MYAIRSYYDVSGPREDEDVTLRVEVDADRLADGPVRGRPQVKRNRLEGDLGSPRVDRVLSGVGLAELRNGRGGRNNFV